jgi:hypothetical protein
MLIHRIREVLKLKYKMWCADIINKRTTEDRIWNVVWRHRKHMKILYRGMFNVKEYNHSNYSTL